MPRLIFKCPYIRGGSKKVAAHLSNYVRYMATREGAQRIAADKAQLPATKKQQQMVEQLLRDFPLSRGTFEYEDYAAAPTRGNAADFITRALEDNYDEFLEFYKARLYVPEEIQPNIGHEIVAKWEKEGYVEGVITQNVDRLHQKACSVNVWELHGSLEPVRCHRCGREGTTADFLAGKPCSYCGGRLRPSVVLFGEMLPQRPLEAMAAKHLSCSAHRSSSRRRTTSRDRLRAAARTL